VNRETLITISEGDFFENIKINNAKIPDIPERKKIGWSD
jgi:hypothetical protein